MTRQDILREDYREGRPFDEEDADNQTDERGVVGSGRTTITKKIG